MPKNLTCASCKVALAYAGTKKFHEGTRWGVFGEIGEMFVNKGNVGEGVAGEADEVGELRLARWRSWASFQS